MERVSRVCRCDPVVVQDHDDRSDRTLPPVEPHARLAMSRPGTAINAISRRTLLVGQKTPLRHRALLQRSRPYAQLPRGSCRYQATSDDGEQTWNSPDAMPFD